MRTSAGQPQLNGNAAESDGDIAAIILAAGSSSRLGAPKQLLVDEFGVTLVVRATTVARDAGANPIVVVTGAHSELVRTALDETTRSSPNVQIVHNDAWNDGVASSIAAGVREVMERGPNVSAVIIIACDMPSVSSAHLESLMQRFRAGAARVASSYGDTRGNPALIARNELSELLALMGDRGAKSLLAREGTATVELDLGTLDIDTPDDITRWRKLSSPQ